MADGRNRKGDTAAFRTLPFDTFDTFDTFESRRDQGQASPRRRYVFDPLRFGLLSHVPI